MVGWRAPPAVASGGHIVGGAKGCEGGGERGAGMGTECAARSAEMSARGSSSGLFEELKTALAVRQYSGSTLDAYEHWVRRFLSFHKGRHPAAMGAGEVSAFVSNLAT